jgi:hypothetical protein
MSPQRLTNLLAVLCDGGDLVLAARGAGATDPLLAAWRAAECEAVRAYEHWRHTRHGDDHAVYRACAARADAAHDALAAAARTA